MTNQTEKHMKTQPTELDHKILESKELRGGVFASELAKASYRAEDQYPEILYLADKFSGLGL